MHLSEISGGIAFFESVIDEIMKGDYEDIVQKKSKISSKKHKIEDDEPVEISDEEAYELSKVREPDEEDLELLSQGGSEIFESDNNDDDIFYGSGGEYEDDEPAGIYGSGGEYEDDEPAGISDEEEPAKEFEIYEPASEDFEIEEVYDKKESPTEEFEIEEVYDKKESPMEEFDIESAYESDASDFATEYEIEKADFKKKKKGKSIDDVAALLKKMIQNYESKR